MTTDQRTRPRELEALRELRLHRGQSFRELARAMTDAGFAVPYRTLANLLRDPTLRPHETTAFRVRAYITHERREGRLPGEVLALLDGSTEAPEDRGGNVTPLTAGASR